MANLFRKIQGNRSSDFIKKKGSMVICVEIIDDSNLVSIGEPSTINVLAQGTIL